MTHDLTKTSKAVIWQEGNGETTFGEPALLVSVYSDIFTIKQGGGEVNINYETIPEMIRLLRTIHPVKTGPTPQPLPPCEWAEDMDGNWDTGCNKVFVFLNYDGPEGNGFKFCPYCGGQLAEVPHEEAQDEEGE